jgi:chromosome partitioning protein
MPVISIISAKGGVGKSTNTLNLAAALAKTHKVLIVDGDPQGSIAQWADCARQELAFDVISEPDPVIDRYIPRVKPHYDLILIDTPPSFREQMDSVLRSSDYLIIPLRPGLTDLWSTQRFLARYRPPEAKMRLLISCLDKRKSIGKDFRRFLAGIGIPVFNTEIPNRVSIEESWLAGQTIDQYQPGGREAEVYAKLGKEVEEWLKGR